MGRKCCVTGCGTGYDADDTTPVFILPKDQLERSRWIQAIPRDNILNSFNTVVCENHWPSGYENVLSYGRHRPKSPPCVFLCVPKSVIPTQTEPRSTNKDTASQRNADVVELSRFTEKDEMPVQLMSMESVADNEQAQLEVISRLLAHLLTSRDVTDVNVYWRFRSRQAVADLQTAVDAQERALNEMRNDVTSLQRAKNKLKADVEEVKGTVTRSTYIRWGRTACAGNSTLLYKGKYVTILRRIYLP